MAINIYLRADASVDYGRILEVINACRRAGSEEVSLVSESRLDRHRN